MSTDPQSQSAGGAPTGDSPTRRQALRTGAAAALAGAAAMRAGRAGAQDGRLANLLSTMRSDDTALKQRAREDYRRSMAPFGGQLANPPEQLFATSQREPDNQFDVVVVGSGYGAAMIASELAPRLAPGRRLAMLERGKEWIPGDFKDTFQGLLAEARGQLTGERKRTVVNPLGVHNVIMNDEVNVWTGNGLGGGSLVNAGIALLPDPDVFWKFKWPRELSSRDVLIPYFQRAAGGLNLARTPWDQTSKVRERRQAADQLWPYDGFFDLSPMAVTLDSRWMGPDGRNPQGMIQRPCTLCGDCISGCNVGAKNTLAMNYLPFAKAAGTEIYTQTEVRTIHKQAGRYRLDLVYYDDRDCGLTRRYTSVWTRMLILAAGSPGSPELLLRSRDSELCFSEALGHRWSGNGDTLGFVINKSTCSRIGGVGAYESNPAPIGPTVQSSLSYKHRPVLEDRFLIQDAAIPRAATNLFKILLNDPELDNSAVMLGMGHDGAVGQVDVDEKGRALIRWPGLKDAAFRRAIWAEFERIAAAEGGEYKRLAAFGDNLVSVHPLGGCALADDPVDGVVNAAGQVFDGACGGCSDALGNPRVHEGLYVADGSIVPSSLGCNPLMTISALALRIAGGILTDPGHRDLFRAA